MRITLVHGYMLYWTSFLKKHFGGHKSFSWGHWYSLFWTSGNVCPRFQSQGGFLACFLTCVILRFTSGVTPADYIGVNMAVEPFWSTYLQKAYGGGKMHKHWWRFVAWTHDHPCRTQQAWRCKPLRHSGSGLLDWLIFNGRTKTKLKFLYCRVCEKLFDNLTGVDGLE